MNKYQKKHKLNFQEFLQRMHLRRDYVRGRTTTFKSFLTLLPKNSSEVLAGIKQEEKNKKHQLKLERQLQRMIKMIDPSGKYQQIDLDKASDDRLLEWYNANSGSSTKLVKFSNRAVAVSRCSQLKKAMDEMQARALSIRKSDTTMSTETKTAGKGKKAAKTATKGKKAPAKSSGAKSSIRDMKIVKIAKANPRREGTEGWKSWEKIKSGMAYLAAIDAGARNVDIRFDVAKGNLKLVKA